MEPFNGDRLFRTTKDVVRRQIGGEVFLVPIRGRPADMQELFVLNQVGSRIWEGLDRERSMAELAEALHSEFDVDVDRALRDVQAFLHQLGEAGLVEAL